MPGGVLYLSVLGSQLPYFSNQALAPVDWSKLTPANTNCTYGIQWIWSFMGQCVMDTQGMVAMVCGFVCLFAWIVNGLPQIIENFRTGIPDQALSPFLLLFWTLGDLSNFVGCILTHQLILQIVVSLYSIASDLVLAGQFVFYKMRHQYMVTRVNEVLGDGEVFLEEANDSIDSAVAMETQPLLNTSTHSRRALAVGFIGLLGITGYASGLPVIQASPADSPSLYTFSSRHLLMFTSTEASSSVPNDSLERMVWHPPFLPETSAKIGYVLGWISSIMYVSSRFPQIFRNWKRGSTEGLCLVLFCLALLGNTAYGLQIFVTSLEPYYLLEALPWLVGSVGVLILDMIICFQFYYYAPRKSPHFSPLQATTSDDSLSNPPGSPAHLMPDSALVTNPV